MKDIHLKIIAMNERECFIHEMAQYLRTIADTIDKRSSPMAIVYHYSSFVNTLLSFYISTCK